MKKLFNSSVFCFSKWTLLLFVVMPYWFLNLTMLQSAFIRLGVFVLIVVMDFLTAATDDDLLDGDFSYGAGASPYDYTIQ